MPPVRSASQYYLQHLDAADRCPRCYLGYDYGRIVLRPFPDQPFYGDNTVINALPAAMTPRYLVGASVSWDPGVVVPPGQVAEMHCPFRR